MFHNTGRLLDVCGESPRTVNWTAVIFVVLLATLVLAGCGGGSSDGDDPHAEPDHVQMESNEVWSRVANQLQDFNCPGRFNTEPEEYVLVDMGNGFAAGCIAPRTAWGDDYSTITIGLWDYGQPIGRTEFIYNDDEILRGRFDDTYHVLPELSVFKEPWGPTSYLPSDPESKPVVINLGELAEQYGEVDENGTVVVPAIVIDNDGARLASEDESQ